MGTASRLAAASMFLALLLSHVPTARAGGLEYNGAGTESAGRGGAWAARADTPMALQLNPAMLSDLPGIQVMLDVNVGLYDACASRGGHYSDHYDPSIGTNPGGAYPDTFPMGWQSAAYPTVCNSTPFSPGASLAVSWQATPDLGFSVGVLTPYAAGAARYGNADGTVSVGGQNLPSPMRYVLAAQNLLQIFPSIGVGWRVAPWLRIGATFQWGIVQIDDQVYGSVFGGETPSYDVLTRLRVGQAFEPAGIFSVAIRPTPGLDIFTAFRVVSEISADGTLEVSGHEWAPPDTTPLPSSTCTPGTACQANPHSETIQNVHLKTPQPWALSGGIRYAMRRNDLDTQLHPRHRDSLATDYFDVELDGVWEINRMVDTFTVTLPHGASFTEPSLGVPTGLPTTNLLPHHWRDQVSVRIGGDWNVVRDLFALRAGFSYESSGVNSAYAQLDFINAERFQLHFGATLRIDDVDISAAYIHIFQSTVDSTAPGLAAFPQNAAAGTPAFVNNAVYTAQFNVFSLGATVHFH